MRGDESEPFARPVPMSAEEVDGFVLTLKERQVRNAEELAKEEAYKREVAFREGRRRADEDAEARRTLKVTSLRTVRPQAVYWLWENRIPLGEVTIIGGKGGIGKSLFLATLVAWITTGKCRGEFLGIPRNVIFQANEDSYEKTVVPRLLAAGADLSRVYRIDVEIEGDPHSLMLPRDLDRVKGLVEETSAVALVIDPLSSSMTDKDRNSPEVRRSYEQLRAFAERVNLAVLGNGHTRKGASSDFLEAFMGSSEIGNVVRAAIGVIKDPDSEEQQVILSQCKNNLGPGNLKSYTYKIVEREYVDPDTGWVGHAPILAWGESTERHVNDIMSDPPSMVAKTDVAEAKEWLHDYLTLEPGTSRKTVIASATRAGHKEHTIKKAATLIKVVSASKPGVFPREVVWSLPVSTVGADSTL